MAQKFCTHCGSPLKPGVNFCTHCGAGVGDNAFSGVAPTATTRTTAAPTTAIPTNTGPTGNAPATAYTGDGLDVPVEQTMVGAPPIDRTQSFQPVVSQPAQPPVYGQPLQPYIPGAQGFDAPGGNRPPKKSHTAVAIAAAAIAVAVVAGGATAFVLLGRDKAADPVAAATTEAVTSQEPATTISEPATTIAATTTDPVERRLRHPRLGQPRLQQGRARDPLRRPAAHRAQRDLRALWQDLPLGGPAEVLRLQKLV